MRKDASHPGVISPQCRWDLTQVDDFFHVNGFCWAVLPRQIFSFSLDSVCFYNY